MKTSVLFIYLWTLQLSFIFKNVQLLQDDILFDLLFSPNINVIQIYVKQFSLFFIYNCSLQVQP
jgi:hypothetical protein